MEFVFYMFNVQCLFGQLIGLRMMKSLIYSISRILIFKNISSYTLMIFFCGKFHCDTSTKKKDTQEWGVEIAFFFHFFGNPKGRTLDYFFYASHVFQNFPYKMIPVSMS